MKLKLTIFIALMTIGALVTEASRLTYVSTGINSPMTRTAIADSLENGANGVSWNLYGSGGTALNFDIDQGDGGAAIYATMNAHNQVGGRAAAITVSLTTGLEGVQLSSTGADSAAQDWDGGGNAYIIFDSTKAWQTINFTAPLSGARVKLIKSFKNYSSGAVLPLFYNGDDYYYDVNGDSVYFDHRSGDTPYIYALAGQNLPWPSTGDSLALLSAADVLDTFGKQGEALWINNSNGGKGATGWGSAPVVVNNSNYLSMPSISLKHSSTAWGTGKLGFGAAPYAAFIHLYMDDCSPPDKGDASGNPVIPPAIYNKCYAIYAKGGEFHLGDAVDDSMHVAGNTEFSNNVRVLGQLDIPYGPSWPASPDTGSTFYLLPGDTLGVYNGAAWKKFVPDA